MKEFFKQKINLLFTMMLVIVLAVDGLIGFNYIIENIDIIVPNYVSKNYKELLDWCNSLPSKYGCEFRFEQSEQYDEKIVIAQSINDGDILDGKIVFTISNGKKAGIQAIEVNEFTTLNDVEIWANKYGLNNVNYLYINDETIDKGIVIKIEPNSNIYEDTVINVYISKGKDVNDEDSIEIKYGDYLNISESEFKDKAEKLGLTINHQTQHDAYSNDIPEGKIVWHGSGIYVKDEAINYGVSLGKNDDEITVKYGDYLNISEEDFKTKTKALGLSPNHNSSKDEYSNDVEKGKIIWHGSGTYEKDETINYGLSLGKNEDQITIKANQYVGLSEQEFKDKAKELNLTPLYYAGNDAFSDKVEKGKVIWHGSGNYVKNETFRYSLSKGPTIKVKLDDTHVGDNENSFISYIKGLNLVPKNDGSEYSDKYEKGVVISYKAGEYEEGSTVKYKVSKGKDTRVTVKDYANKSETSFTEYILGLGLNLGTKTTKASSSVKEGYIISNDTGLMNVGDSVNYTVSSGKSKSELMALSDLINNCSDTSGYETAKSKVESKLSYAGFTNYEVVGRKDKSSGDGVILSVTVDGADHIGRNTYNSDAKIVVTISTGLEQS